MPETDDLLKINLDSDKELVIAKEIEEGLETIVKERNDIDFLSNAQIRQDLYDGIVEFKDFPWEDAANYFLHITSMMCDIVVIKAKRQTLVNPIILLEAKEREAMMNQIEGMNIEGVPIGEDTYDWRDAEDRLDFRLRRDIKIEDLVTPVYREACVQGTSFVKCPKSKQVDYVTILATYKGQADIEKYKQEAGREHDQVTRLRNLEILDKGGEVKAKRDTEKLIYEGPKPYRVPLQNLFLRPKIKDLRRQRLISERMEFTWSDIQYRADTDFYWKTAIEKLKEKSGPDYFKNDYVVYESLLYTNTINPKRFQRYVFTMEDKTKTILRAIHYPYNHNFIYYVPYYIIPRDDMVYGYSIAERLRDTNKIMNNLWNIALDLAALRSNPPKQISDLTATMRSTKWGPGAVYKSKVPEAIRVIPMEPFSMDSIKILPLAQRFGEMCVGVTAGMTGKETPLDPRAPAAKTAMLMEAGNIRIEDYIFELQKGNSGVSQQIDELDMQYFGKQPYPADVRYVPHGSTITVNKPQELNSIMAFIDLCINVYPEVLQNPESRYVLLKAFVDTIGGTIEKQKKKLLPNVLQPQQPNVMEILEMVQGMTPEDIREVMEKVKRGEPL